MATGTPLARLLGLLLLLVALAAPLAAAWPGTTATGTAGPGPHRLHSRALVDEKKTTDSCSVTAQCPTCASQGLRAGTVQCCWPRGQGYGSPFDAPGFCICAAAGRFDYSQCLGSFWGS